MQVDKKDSSELKCDTCELNKAKRKPVPKDSVDRANNALDIVHVDILGLVKLYQLTITDMQFHLLTVSPDIRKFTL